MKPASPTLVPVGALVGAHGVTYRVWAPGHRSVAVVVGMSDPVSLALSPEPGGYWSVHHAGGRAGDRYALVVDGGKPLPDPASRWQPDGVHGPSACVDPAAFAWAAAWQRPGWQGQPIYELHVGTFTPEGTFRSALHKLDYLQSVGIAAIELMPLGDFPGARNWGYDGVALYAPARCYGSPDDLRALVDAAHLRGLAVILDVVYNHLGPVGNYLPQFSPHYFHSGENNAWGAALNLDGPESAGTRNFLLGNAAYWIDEFRFDGLRVDATHAIRDRSPRHFLTDLSDVAHARGAFLIAEDERNSPLILQGAGQAGHGFDAVWADDFHHQLRVALTGIRESYFASYPGGAAALADTLAHGWFYRGQPYPFWQGRERGGESAPFHPSSFVVCIENHDQVGNRARGERLEHLVSPGAYRAALLLLCLGPYTPMLFMGQEWASHSPFLFFTDHAGEHGRQVAEGRQQEFARSGLNAGVTDVPDPQDPDTFSRSKLDWDRAEETTGAETLQLVRAALVERGRFLGPGARARTAWSLEAAGPLLVIRYRHELGDRALVFATAAIAAETPAPGLLGLPAGQAWTVDLVSDVNASFQPRSGGQFRCAGPTAWWLHPEP